MINSYCGKNCFLCISYNKGKCIGCMPEVHVPIQNAVYIAGLKNTTEERLLPDKTAQADEEAVEDIDGIRFSNFCRIAQCCRNSGREGCGDCRKSFACDAYSKKGIMNTIIESKMEAWGMVDHGLKNAVPYLYILLFCMLTEFIFPLTSVYPDISQLFFIISGIISASRAYAYFRLRVYNTDFMTVTALTIAYIFAILFERLLNAIDYGLIGTLLSVACVLVQAAASILCCKISFDAYAELVSCADNVLETRWLKLWRLTVFFYIIALAAGFLNLKMLGISSFTLCFAVASGILNIIASILMIATIKVCKNDCSA